MCIYIMDYSNRAVTSPIGADSISGDSMSSITSTSNNTPTKKIRYCSKCQKHGVKIDRVGHKRVCPFIDCRCKGCTEVEERRAEMSRGVMIKRAMNLQKDKEKRDSEAFNNVKVPRRIEIENPVPTFTLRGEEYTLTYGEIKLYKTLDLKALREDPVRKAAPKEETRRKKKLRHRSPVKIPNSHLSNGETNDLSLHGVERLTSDTVMDSIKTEDNVPVEKDVTCFFRLYKDSLDIINECRVLGWPESQIQLCLIDALISSCKNVEEARERIHKVDEEFNKYHDLLYQHSNSLKTKEDLVKMGLENKFYERPIDQPTYIGEHPPVIGKPLSSRPPKSVHPDALNGLHNMYPYPYPYIPAQFLQFSCP